MAMPIKLTATRVAQGAKGRRPLDGMGCCNEDYPQDGCLLEINLPGSVSIYLSEDDLVVLTTGEVGEVVELKSWATEVQDGQKDSTDNQED